MTGKRGRRSYSKAFKRRVVAETLEPNASVAAVARRHGLNANMLFLWRRDPRFGPGRDATSFLPVEVSDPDIPAAPTTTALSVDGNVEIVLPSGTRLILNGTFDPDLVLRLARGLVEA